MGGGQVLDPGWEGGEGKRQQFLVWRAEGEEGYWEDLLIAFAPWELALLLLVNSLGDTTHILHIELAKPCIIPRNNVNKFKNFLTDLMQSAKNSPVRAEVV